MILEFALALLSLVVFLGVPSLTIWLVVRATRRPPSAEAVRIVEQSRKAEAELVRKAGEDWSPPPELNLPAPRPIRRAHLGIRLLGSLPTVFLLTIFMVFIYTFGFIIPHGMPGGRPQELPSFIFHAFLDFLQAPQWQGWMLWPSVIFGGLTGLIVLSGYFTRRKQQKLLRWGNPARAVVSSWSTSRGNYTWTLQYHDAAGNTVNTSLDNRRSKPEMGQVLTVLYDPDKPQRFITYPVARYEIRVAENY